MGYLFHTYWSIDANGTIAPKPQREIASFCDQQTIVMRMHFAYMNTFDNALDCWSLLKDFQGVDMTIRVHLPTGNPTLGHHQRDLMAVVLLCVPVAWYCVSACLTVRQAAHRR